jgi:hypothetical protein
MGHTSRGEHARKNREREGNFNVVDVFTIEERIN